MQKRNEPSQTRITAFLAGHAVGQKRSSAALADQAAELEFSVAVTAICQEIDDTNLDQSSALRTLAMLCTAIVARASNASALVKLESRILAALWYGTFSPNAQQARTSAPFAGARLVKDALASSPQCSNLHSYNFDFIRLCSSSSTSPPPFQISSTVRTALGLGVIEVSESNQNFAHTQFAAFAAQRRLSVAADARSSVLQLPLEPAEAAVSELSVPVLGALLTTLRAGAARVNSDRDDGERSFSAYISGLASGAPMLAVAASAPGKINQSNAVGLADIVVDFYLNSLTCVAHQACSFQLLHRHRVFASHVAHRVAEAVCRMNASQLQTTLKLCLHTLGAACVEIRDPVDAALLSDTACALLFRVLVVVHNEWSTECATDSSLGGDLFAHRSRSGAALDYSLRAACADANCSHTPANMQEHDDDDDSQCTSLSWVLTEHEVQSMRMNVKATLAAVILLWHRTVPPTRLERIHRAMTEVILAVRNAAVQRLLIDVLSAHVFTELLHRPVPMRVVCADDAVRVCIEAALAQWRERSTAPVHADAVDVAIGGNTNDNDNGNCIGAHAVEVGDTLDSRYRSGMRSINCNCNITSCSCSVGGDEALARSTYSLRAALVSLAALVSMPVLGVELTRAVQSVLAVNINRDVDCSCSCACTCKLKR